MSDLDQAGGEVVIDQTAPEVGGTDEAAFFEYGEGDNALSFKDQDALKAHLDKSINFERDYTRKSQQRESEYRTKMDDYTRQKQEFDKAKSDWETGEKAKYDQYSEAMKRRPAIAQELARLANKPVTPDEQYTRNKNYADEQNKALMERLDAIDSRYEQEQLEKQTDGIYAELESQYPDFNRDSVKEALGALDGNDTRGLIEMMWKAGQYDPAGVQAKVEENIAKKAGSGMLKTGGGSPPQKQSGSTDPKIAREEAQKWASSG